MDSIQDLRQISSVMAVVFQRLWLNQNIQLFHNDLVLSNPIHIQFDSLYFTASIVLTVFSSRLIILIFEK